MSERKDDTLPELEIARPANRRQFLGTAAVAAVAATGVSTLLAACGESATAARPDASARQPDGARASLGGGRDPGVTLHLMAAATLGHGTDVTIPALEKGVTTKYIQRVVTDASRTGTGLATVLKALHQFTDANKTTVQVIVQDSRGTRWAARSIKTNSDLAFAMKDALLTNTLNEGVLKSSVNAGSAVVALSKSSLVAFQDGVASDFYGNHLDIASRGFSDLFNATVSGISIASTTRDLNRC